MAYLNATQAAERLGVSEKTVRRWIQEKRLAAFHPHGYKNRLAIAEGDIEKLKQERAEFEQPDHKQGPAAASEDIEKRIERVENWLSDLQRWYDALDKRLEVLEQGVSIATHQDGKGSILPIQSHAEALKKKPGPKAGSILAEPPKEISKDSVGYAAFAEAHGIHERTARDHIDKGYIPAFVRARPSNPRFKERWLRPEDQLAALDFWQSHETSGFRTCPDCPHKVE